MSRARWELYEAPPPRDPFPCPGGCGGTSTDGAGAPCAPCLDAIMSAPPEPCEPDCDCCAAHDPEVTPCPDHPEFPGCCPCCVDCRSVGPF